MKNILLIADAGGEIGWGHAMRTLAVAEALEGRAVVRWLTSTPKEIRGLDPPCPVDAGEMLSGYGDAMLVDHTNTHLCIDGDPNPTDGQVWHMIDHGTGLPGTNRICPHFGAENRDWGPGMVATGPRWMALREGLVAYAIMYPKRATRTDGKVLTYRASGKTLDLPDDLTVMFYDEQLEPWWTHGPFRYAIVPPSTIAYECMALGIPVFLVPVEGQSTEIGDAMVTAGVATWWVDHADAALPAVESAASQASRARNYVDGRGAERVANLLLGEG